MTSAGWVYPNKQPRDRPAFESVAEDGREHAQQCAYTRILTHMLARVSRTSRVYLLHSYGTGFDLRIPSPDACFPVLLPRR